MREICKIQKPAWETETLEAIRHAQRDVEKAVSSVKILSEFIGNPDYFRWRAEDLQKHLSILWALEDGLIQKPGIASYGGEFWPRGNSRAYTNEERHSLNKARRMIEKA